jgi:hypothetical protein
MPSFDEIRVDLSGWSEFADLMLAQENLCLAVPANHN